MQNSEPSSEFINFTRINKKNTIPTLGETLNNFQSINNAKVLTEFDNTSNNINDNIEYYRVPPSSAPSNAVTNITTNNNTTTRNISSPIKNTDNNLLNFNLPNTNNPNEFFRYLNPNNSNDINMKKIFIWSLIILLKDYKNKSKIDPTNFSLFYKILKKILSNLFNSNNFDWSFIENFNFNPIMLNNFDDDTLIDIFISNKKRKLNNHNDDEQNKLLIKESFSNKVKLLKNFNNIDNNLKLNDLINKNNLLNIKINNYNNLKLKFQSNINNTLIIDFSSLLSNEKQQQNYNDNDSYQLIDLNDLTNNFNECLQKFDLQTKILISFILTFKNLQKKKINKLLLINQLNYNNNIQSIDSKLLLNSLSNSLSQI